MSDATEYWQDKTRLYLNDLIESQANRAMIEAMRAMHNRLLHLESQAAQTAESPAQSPATETASASSSLRGIERVAGTNPTWPISSTWSYPVSLSGDLPLSVGEDILGWLNSQRIPGRVLEVEIGVTLTSKGGTPLRGWPSPSTEEPSPSASGAPGTDAAATPSQAGREPLTIRDAARDPSFVTEPELYVLPKGAVVDGKEEYIRQIFREHNAYQDAVAALEKIVLTASSADDPMTVQQRWTKAVRLADAALQSIKEQGA